MNTVVSVPGKVHLMGEHAVVYGKPAFLAAVDRRLTVSVSYAATMSVEAPEGIDHIKRAIALVRKMAGINNPRPINLRVASDIPAGYHLGSSAALAVGIAGAVTYLDTRTWNPVRINRMAFEIEKSVHGTPSGGDNSAVTAGGFTWFRKELPFLTSIWQLSMDTARLKGAFMLVDTGRPEETTGQMVARVRARYDARPSAMARVFGRNEEAARRIATSMHTSDGNGVNDAIRIGHRTLVAMGVVSKPAYRFARALEREGGAAKILGGGGIARGVGFMLAFHEKKAVISQTAARFGFSAYPVVLGGPGVRLEEKG